VVGWLVAIDNSDDIMTPLLTSRHQRVSYAKLLREYTLPLTFFSRLVIVCGINDWDKTIFVK